MRKLLSTSVSGLSSRMLNVHNLKLMIKLYIKVVNFMCNWCLRVLLCISIHT